MIEWAIVNRRDDADDVDKRLAEVCDTLPSSAAESEHRGQQQGAQEEYVVKAGPDVPDTGSKEIEKLAPERRRMTFELPGFVVRAENRGMGARRSGPPAEAIPCAADRHRAEALYLMLKNREASGQMAVNRMTS